jgi:hypothetical protein
MILNEKKTSSKAVKDIAYVIIDDINKHNFNTQRTIRNFSFVGDLDYFINFTEVKNEDEMYSSLSQSITDKDENDDYYGAVLDDNNLISNCSIYIDLFGFYRGNELIINNNYEMIVVHEVQHVYEKYKLLKKYGDNSEIKRDKDVYSQTINNDTNNIVLKQCQKLYYSSRTFELNANVNALYVYLKNNLTNHNNHTELIKNSMLGQSLTFTYVFPRFLNDRKTLINQEVISFFYRKNPRSITVENFVKNFTTLSVKTNQYLYSKILQSYKGVCEDLSINKQKIILPHFTKQMKETKKTRKVLFTEQQFNFLVKQDVLNGLIKEDSPYKDNEYMLLSYRERMNPNTFSISSDDPDNVADFILDQYGYVYNKVNTDRKVNPAYLLIDPKWKPGQGFSDIYGFTKRIATNEVAMNLITNPAQLLGENDYRTPRLIKVKDFLKSVFKQMKSYDIDQNSPYYKGQGYYTGLMPYLIKIIKNINGVK